MTTDEVHEAWAGAIVVFTMIVVAGVMSLCAGCGASANSQHRTLNTITDAADPTYELALEGCDVARDAIVARTGTTYAEDVAAMAEVNRVCDGIVLGFEALRATQLTARAAIDAGAEGAVREAILEALRLWAQLQQMTPELDTLGREGGV
jgi:hypothetical protein